LATASAATLPAAPARFSMMTGWPIDSDILAPTRRASTSTAPPAANGTITRIGFIG